METYVLRVFFTRYIPWDRIPIHFEDAHELNSSTLGSWCRIIRFTKPFNTIFTFEPEFFDRSGRPNQRGVREAIADMTPLTVDRRNYSKRFHIVFADASDAIAYTSLYPANVIMDRHRILDQSDVEAFYSYIIHCHNLPVREQRDPSPENRFKEWHKRLS